MVRVQFEHGPSLELLKRGFKKLQLKHYKLTSKLKLGHKLTVILKQIIDVSPVQLGRSVVVLEINFTYI